MLADTYTSNNLPVEFMPAGKLDEKTLPCVSRDAVIGAIEKGLCEFIGRETSRNIKNEKGITNRLCKILNCHKLIYFHHEGMQDETSGSSPSVDIEAIATEPTLFEARLFSKEQTLMAIEAKRLPSPPPKTREREYLVGTGKNTGGVERFKLGIHGKDCLCRAMVGYVQESDFKSWHETINDWVEGLAKTGLPNGFWQASEKLELISETASIARCRSRHHRKSDELDDEIEVIHVWVRILNEASTT